MKKIYKYTLEVEDEQQIEMPEDAEMLSVQIQNGSICVWAIVDTASHVPVHLQKFYVRGTGHETKGVEDKIFLGTIQMQGGALIFHVFYD